MFMQHRAAFSLPALLFRLRPIAPLLPIFIYAFVCLHLEAIHKDESLAAAPPGAESFHIDVAPGLLSFGVGIYLLLWLLWLVLGPSQLSLRARAWFLAIFLPEFSALIIVGYFYGLAPYEQPRAAILLDDTALVCNGARFPWASVGSLEEYSAIDNSRGSVLGWAIVTQAATPAAPAAKTWCRITPMIAPSHEIFTAIERRWLAHRGSGKD
jgi:hypothetical protein